MSNKKYYFSGWEFDCNQDTIKHDSQPNVQKLEPQLAALLRLLIENRKQVLSKAQLNEALWPNTVVEENSVYQILTKLRKKLADPPKQSNIIRTFPKKGYQFIAELEEENTRKQSIVKELSTKRHFKLSTWLIVLLATFSAIAYYSTKQPSTNETTYISKELTTDLGLESWPTPHPENGSYLYIKDEHQLKLTNDNQNTKIIFTSKNRLFYPAWSDSGNQIAFWQFDGDYCQLSVLNVITEELTLSSKKSCDYLERIIWLNTNQVVALFRQNGISAPYQYNIDTDKFIQIPLLLNKDEYLKTAVKAWQDELYYVVIDGNYNSRLIDSNGNTNLKWQHPVKFAAFDKKSQRLIINDKSKHTGLKSVGVDGNIQPIIKTAQGIFSSIATSTDGDIYATAENWQVNIKDKNDLPIFSSTTLDYLPVSNILGETAFMSRRDGFCQIYLYQNEKVQQLSHFDNYDTVKFVQWSPDLQLILTNRDNSAYIYNRQGLVQTFPLSTNILPTSFGWLSNKKVYSFDGKFLRYYHFTGERSAEFILNANFVHYQYNSQTWWLFKEDNLYSVNGELLNEQGMDKRISLNLKQRKNISDVRIINKHIYWKSRHKNRDYIWQYSTLKASIVLMKTGKFIWSYDINAKDEMTTAIKENIEGNIYLFSKE